MEITPLNLIILNTGILNAMKNSSDAKPEQIKIVEDMIKQLQEELNN